MKFLPDLGGIEKLVVGIKTEPIEIDVFRPTGYATLGNKFTTVYAKLDGSDYLTIEGIKEKYEFTKVYVRSE